MNAERVVWVFGQFNKSADWVLRQVVWVVFACMVILLGFLVTGRYFFGVSPVWTVEVSQYLFVWLSALGICLAYRRGAHISLAHLWAKTPLGTPKSVRWAIHTSVIAMGWFMLDGGITLMQTFGGDRSPGTGIPMAWVYASLVASGTLLCVFGIEVSLREAGAMPPQRTPPAN